MSKEFVSEAAEAAVAAEAAEAAEAEPAREVAEEALEEAVEAAEGLAATVEEAAEEEDTPSLVEPIRQWVSLPRSSCVCWVGHGAIEKIGVATRGNATSLRACAFVVEEGTPADVVEAVRRQLTDAQYEVGRIDLPADSLRTLDGAALLCARLAEVGITADDLVCAVGGIDALSLAAHVCVAWNGGVELATVALDLASAIIAPITPRGFDVAGHTEVVNCAGHPRYVFVDLDLMDLDPATEPVRLARAVMAQTALIDSEKSFSNLWDRAAGIASGDVFALAEQLIDTLKSRGRIVASTSVAVRQTIGCGETFVRAVGGLVPGAPGSVLVGEALRFATRLAAGKGQFEVDDVLAVDELLERLGIGTLSCEVDPAELLGAIRAERFSRSRRFLLGLPKKLGQVRMATVEDDLLRDHTAAWCAVHHA